MFQKGIFPFKDVKLDRDDIEWLLANHKPQYAQVNWMGQVRRELLGLDLRGADLRGVDLRGISLTNMRGGLDMEELAYATIEQRDMAGIHLEGANLNNAYLKGAFLGGAHLDYTFLGNTNLENAYLDGANLAGANLSRAYLKNAGLAEASLRGAHCLKAHLEGAWLSGARLQGADFSEANLEKANLRFARLEGANLREATLKGAILSSTNLMGAFLSGAHLEEVDLAWADLAGASLFGAHLEGANLNEAHLEGKQIATDDLELIRKQIKDFPVKLPPVNLRRAFFDAATNLEGATLGGVISGNKKGNRFISLADVHWGGANLAVVDWKLVNSLGDEYEARQSKRENGDTKSASTRLNEYKSAARANRQLAVALQEQGLSEESTYFAYKAQLLQRVVLRRERKFGRYLFSLFLDLLAGYGYRPGRSAIAYLVIIFGFMGLYLLNAHFVIPHLRWDEALVLSLSSFHGRGFFSQDITLGDTYARLAAAEAVVGLLIEVSLIATFTQRFFGK